MLTGLLVLLLAACSSLPELDSRDARTPEGVDLSGHWKLREDQASAALTRPAQDEQPLIGRGSRDARESRTRRDSSVHVFIEYGKSLKITQTPYGVFISFDRAVVEEYTFGENRVVTIGPIEAQRVSGWEGRSFIIETLDRSGTVLQERWAFESDDVLLRRLLLKRGEDVTFSLQQRFDRQ